jgi:hypothetical protein
LFVPTLSCKKNSADHRNSARAGEKITIFLTTPGDIVQPTNTASCVRPRAPHSALLRALFPRSLHPGGFPEESHLEISVPEGKDSDTLWHKRGSLVRTPRIRNPFRTRARRRTQLQRVAESRGYELAQCCAMHQSAGNYKTNSHQNSHQFLKLKSSVSPRPGVNELNRDLTGFFIN